MLHVQCPQCDIQLALDPKVINRSLGWARCGACQHVFDAGRAALPTLEPIHASLLQNHASRDWPSLDLNQDGGSAQGDTVEPISHGATSPVENSAPPGEQLHSPPTGPSDAWSHANEEPPEADVAYSDAVPQPHLAQEPLSASAASAQTDDPSSAVEGPDETEVEHPTDSAMQANSDDLRAETMERNWTDVPPTLISKPCSFAKRVLYAAVFIALGGAAMLQWVWGQRDLLAAQHPEWRPHLERLAHWGNKKVDVVQDVRQLNIAYSSITRTDDGQFQLELELRNDGGLAVAVPQLELSLLNTDGRIWARRVLDIELLQTNEKILQSQSRHAAQTFWRMTESDANLVESYKLRLVYN